MGSVTYVCPTCYRAFSLRAMCVAGHDPVRMVPITWFDWYCMACRLVVPDGMECRACGRKGLDPPTAKSATSSP